MNGISLEKCPFCSGSAYIIKGHGIYGGIGYQIKCSRCEAVTPIEESGTQSVVDANGFRKINISDIEAIGRLSNLWNTRQAT